MIEFLIAMGIILGMAALYATIGIVYARRRAVAVYQRYYAEKRSMFRYTPDADIARAAAQWTRDDLVMKAWFWPLEMLQELFAGGSSLLMKPVVERQRRAAALVRDAETWERVAEQEVDDEKRAMAEELARILREQAKEVEPR